MSNKFELGPVPMPDLAGRKYLVTGAARGIGAVVAGTLAGQGAKVYAGVFREVDPVWQKHLADTTVVQLDVSNQLEVDHIVARIREESGSLDGLVNNAGVILPIGHATAVGSDSMRLAFEVNVIGLHRVTCACLPLLRQAKGVVVNAGTGAATTPMEGWAAYCSSKAAARMMTQMFAAEQQGGEIRYRFLGIPPTDTDMQADIRQSGLNPISEIAREDLVEPEVVASIIAWLFGPDARKVEDVLLDVRDELFRGMME